MIAHRPLLYVCLSSVRLASVAPIV